MNDLYGATVNAKGKKIRSSAALALVLGLALVLPGAAALAGEPIPGVDVKLGKNPGGSIMVTAPTGADGAYQFKGLASGKYDLSIAGQFVQTISVDKGTISGVLSREPDGKASITFNGQVGVVHDLPSAPVNTSRSNKKAGIAKGEVPPPVVGPSTRSAGGETNDALMGVSTTRGTAPRPDGGDVKPGIAEANSAMSDVSTTRGTAPRQDGGDVKLPGLATPGTPIVGIPIGLEGDPEGVKVSAKTDVNGAYQFTGLPAGKYKLILPDKSVKSITIDAGGTTRGKVMRSGDGVMVTGDFEGSPAKVIGAIAIGTKSPAGTAPGKAIEIFDRWGTTGGISGGFGGGASIPGIGGAGVPGAGGMGGAGIPGAGVHP